MESDSDENVLSETAGPVTLDKVRPWSTEALFYSKYPHLKILNRLKEMTDIKGLKLTPEDLKQRYPPDGQINLKVSHWHGDITQLKIDAIVNAAHPGLTGGGGVDWYVHKRAGDGLLQECLGLGDCKIGEAKITGGHQLPAQHVIHTVGPMREDPTSLELCYKNSLDLLVKTGLRVVAFPCISTGHYGFPIVHATNIVLDVTRKWLESNREKVDRIIFCTYTVRDEAVYQALLPAYFPPHSD